MRFLRRLKVNDLRASERAPGPSRRRDSNAHLYARFHDGYAATTVFLLNIFLRSDPAPLARTASSPGERRIGGAVAGEYAAMQSVVWGEGAAAARPETRPDTGQRGLKNGSDERPFPSDSRNGRVAVRQMGVRPGRPATAPRIRVRSVRGLAFLTEEPNGVDRRAFRTTDVRGSGPRGSRSRSHCGGGFTERSVSHYTDRRTPESSLAYIEIIFSRGLNKSYKKSLENACDGF